MLPRAALRVCRPRITANASIVRGYAAAKRPPPPPKPHPSATLRSAQGPKSATGQARQTSPGTSFLKDQTWKPKDGIKLGGPAATTPSRPNVEAQQQVDGAAIGLTPEVSLPQQHAHNAALGASAPQTPIQGTRPQDETPGTGAPRAGTQEPVAQRIDVDEPVTGSMRDQVQAVQAAAENTESPTQPEKPQQPQKPLPDLRQGIPSAFAMEFGNDPRFKEGGKTEREAAAEEQERDYNEERDRQDRDGNQDRAAYETSLDRRRAKLANYLYIAIVAGATFSGLWLARPFNDRDEFPQGFDPDSAHGWEPQKMVDRVRARFSSQLGYYTEPTFPKLLPEVPLDQRPKYTLVVSLEDLLVHSSWDRTNGYRVAKRPGVDYFIRYLSQYYELVLFTSAPKYASDQIMAKLDPFHFILWQLGREATKYEGGEYIKDLSYLNRPLDKTMIIDTRAGHVKNQPENAILLPKWNGDAKDPHARDLVGLIPFLEYIATMGIDDCRKVLKSFEGTDIPVEFARREAEARKKFMAELEAEKSRRPSRSLGVVGSALGFKGGMGGNMVLPDGSSVSEGLSKGKMLSDQFREAGQKQYEFIEQQIRENGAQWLKEEEEEQKKLIDAEMAKTKRNAGSLWGVFGGSSEE